MYVIALIGAIILGQAPSVQVEQVPPEVPSQTTDVALPLNPQTPSTPAPASVVPEQKAPEEAPTVPVPMSDAARAMADGSNTMWLPFDDEVQAHAKGSTALCELLLLPAVIVPGVSEVASIVTDLLCIVPTVIALDHWAVHHGGRKASYWEATLALLARRGIVTLVEVPQVAALVAGFVGGGLIAGALVVSVPYVPSAALVGIGLLGGLVTYGGLKIVADKLGEAAFVTLYQAFTSQATLDEQAALQAQGAGWPQAPLEGVVVPYATLSMLAGTRATFAWDHLIPVVGAWRKEQDRAQQQSLRFRRFVKEDLRSEPVSWDGVDTSMQLMASSAGLLGAASQVLFISAAATLGAALVYGNGDLDNRPVAEGIGWTAVGIGGAGVGLLVMGYLANRIEPVVVGLTYAASSKMGALQADPSPPSRPAQTQMDAE
jgi:hypothetical protein